jgi:hypothetical protein
MAINAEDAAVVFWVVLHALLCLFAQL